MDGEGQDSLTGGVGADTVLFTALSYSTDLSTTCDVISDFAQGTDRISLSAIGASTLIAGNNSFVFQSTIGTALTGEVSFQQFDFIGTSFDYTLVLIDTNATADAEAFIRLTGLYTLTAGDFILERNPAMGGGAKLPPAKLGRIARKFQMRIGVE